MPEISCYEGDNSKADFTLTYGQNWSDATKRGLAVKRYRKPTNTRTAPLPLQQQIATEVNLVIEGLSD